MTVEIFVQARMGSSRLPGKVLMPVLGRPLLSYLIERLQNVKKAQHILVVTSINPLDEEILKFCEKSHIDWFRGNEDDVLSRFYKAAKQRDLKGKDAIVRITADCPLIDPLLVDEVIEVYLEGAGKFDYVSNSLEKTYPRGLDVELFSVEALKIAYDESVKTFEREHVTPYFYMNSNKFHLQNLQAPRFIEDYRWTVDTTEDFLLIKNILEELGKNNLSFEWEKIEAIMEKYPSWTLINSHIKQKQDPRIIKNK